MEVIRHGNTYKEVECEKCNALLSYCKADITKLSKCQEVFGGDWYSSEEQYLYCPECNEKIILSLIVDGEKIK